MKNDLTTEVANLKKENEQLIKDKVNMKNSFDAKIKKLQTEVAYAQKDK